MMSMKSAKMTLATEIIDRSLAEEVATALEDVMNFEIIEWQDGIGEKGALASKGIPNVVIVDDAPQYGALNERIEHLRSSYPNVTVFVVSMGHKPEQIVAAMKAGASEFFIHPLSKNQIENALGETHARLVREGHFSKGRVFTFVSAKGGCGSTVIAANTAVSICQKKEYTAALCDLSCQSGDSTVLLDLRPKTDMADIAANFHRLDAALLKDCMTRHSSGLDLLAAPDRPERSEEIRAGHVTNIIELLKQLYETVIIDCASMYVNESEVEAYRQSEKVFIVTELSLPALRNATRLKRLLSELGISSERIEFVVNRYQKGGSLSLEGAEDTLKKKIFWLFPNDYNDVMHSINQGTPIVKLMPHSQLATNITAFVERLFNPKADSDFRGIRGMFGKAV